MAAREDWKFQADGTFRYSLDGLLVAPAQLWSELLPIYVHSTSLTRSRIHHLFAARPQSSTSGLDPLASQFCAREELCRFENGLDNRQKAE